MKKIAEKCSDQAKSLKLGKELYSQQLVTTSDPKNQARLKIILADIETKMAELKTLEAIVK
jgi:hypothetical protein